MKKITSQTVISDMELLHIPITHIEKMIKDQLARSLANELMKHIEITERVDHHTNTKRITAEAWITDGKTVVQFNQMEHKLKIIKEMI